MRKRPGVQEEKKTYTERPVLKRRRAEDHGKIFGRVTEETVVNTPGSPEWKKRHRIVWYTAGSLLLAGVVLSYQHLGAALIAGLIGGSVASVLAEIPRVDKIKFPYNLVSAWAGAALLFGLILFLMIPVWHRQSLSYAEKVQGITAEVSEKVETDLNLTARASNVVDAAADDNSDALDLEEKTRLERGAEEAQALLVSGASRLGDKTSRGIKRFDEVLKKFRAHSSLLYLQSLLLAGGLMLVSWDLSQPPAANAGSRKKWFLRMGDGLINFSLKAISWLGTFALTRFAKGLVMGLLVSLGLLAGGVKLAWFIGGLSGIGAFFLRPGYLLGLILAFTLVPGSPNMIRALGALLGTIIFLFFLEKRIHWYTCLLPTLHAGFTPRAVRPQFDNDGNFAGPRHTFWGTVRTMTRIFRLVSTLTAIGSLCLLAWAVLPSYKQEKIERAAISAVERITYAGKPEKALEQYDALADKYPDNPEILYGRVKAHVEARDYEKALATADALAAWAPKTAGNLSLKQTIYHRFRGYVFTDYADEDPGRGYAYILNNGAMEDNAPLLETVGTRLLALNDRSEVALRVLAGKALKDNDAAAVLAYADRGLNADPGGPGWHALKAYAYQMNADWENVRTSAVQELERDPDNEDLKDLKAMAEKVLEKQAEAPGNRSL